MSPPQLRHELVRDGRSSRPARRHCRTCTVHSRRRKHLNLPVLQLASVLLQGAGGAHHLYMNFVKDRGGGGVPKRYLP